jgi:hypothetical protein
MHQVGNGTILRAAQMISCCLFGVQVLTDTDRGGGGGGEDVARILCR